MSICYRSREVETLSQHVDRAQSLHRQVAPVHIHGQRDAGVARTASNLYAGVHWLFRPKEDSGVPNDHRVHTARLGAGR